MSLTDALSFLCAGLRSIPVAGPVRYTPAQREQLRSVHARVFDAYRAGDADALLDAAADYLVRWEEVVC